MSENSYFENNLVTLSGEVVCEPIFSHEIYGEKYYTSYISVKRLSDNKDTIPITISERFFGDYYPRIGDFITVIGQYRSYNNYSGKGNKLVLTVFIKEITFAEKVEESKDYDINPNNVYLNGYICREPSYRTTPFSREISDILLAVNRSYNKSDYIPCIAWGRNAKFAQSLKVGTNLKIWGRIQSREYQKHITENDVVSKTAYEVSITKMEVVDNLKDKENEE